MTDPGLDWFIPLVSCSALAVWLAVFRAALPSLRGGSAMSIDAELAIWAAVLSAAAGLAASSLLYPDIITTDMARLSLFISRVALLVTGVVTWWELRAR